MQTLHKYQILEKIGVGGFGVVYKATDPFIKRFVAIKTCTMADAETRERFLREAEIAGNLHHRNIVTVYDFGFEDETPYLVQEYLTGEDLDRKIKRQEFLPLPEKILYLVQIARGLQYAHANGVVHRDIKPANIRILEDDTAKIMDFGIAKLAQQQQSLTQAGITLGTASYLAPEQIRGEPSDSRTDIFSFGALAYELIAFERPFAGAEISAIFYRILNEAVTPLRELAPDCPPELERIVMRCLEKDPATRYQSCQQLVLDLEEIGRRRAAGEHGARPAAAPSVSASSATHPSHPVTASSAERALAEVRSEARGQARNRGIGDVELDAAHPHAGLRGEGVAGKRAAGVGGAGRESGGAGRLWKALGLLVLLGTAAWGAWRLQDEIGARSVESPIGSPMAGSAPATAPIPAPEPPKAAAPEDTASVPGSPPPAESATSGDSADPAPAVPGVETPATPAPVEVSPPPKPAILIVEPGWDSAMSVRLGKKSWPLDRERRFELEAGSYRLRFAIASPSYSHEEESSVRLAAGESRRIASPIARPGRLTIQPHLNTPQGFVRLDGAFAGATPLRGRWLSPGPHRVEIAAAPDPSSPALLSEMIEIASEQETILSFDLDGRVERRVSSRPALPN